MSLDELRAIDPREVVENLGVPIGPARLKCALLSYKVLQGAVIGAEHDGRTRPRCSPADPRRGTTHIDAGNLRRHDQRLEPNLPRGDRPEAIALAADGIA